MITQNPVPSPSLNPQRERVLFMVGEAHLDRQENRALDISRSFSAKLPPHFVVRTFLEGVRNENSVPASAERGMEITGVGSGAVSNMYWPLALAGKLARFCHIASAHGSPRYPNARSILKSAEQEADLFYAITKTPKPSEPILAIQGCMLTDMGYAAAMTGSYLPERLDPATLMAALEEMPDTVSGNLPPKISHLLITILSTITPEKTAQFHELAAQAAKFFGEPEKHHSGEHFKQLVESVKSGKTYAAHTTISSAFSAVQELRETIMAFFIASSEFDVGIFNCGWNHAVSKRLHRLLEQQGISIRVE